jgi:hypothetical protein
MVLRNVTRVVWWIGTNISDEPIASIFRKVWFQGAGTRLLRNLGRRTYLRNFTAQHSTKQKSVCLQPHVNRVRTYNLSTVRSHLFVYVCVRFTIVISSLGLP